jgi:thiol-disulfide isomerase/thioredoxin
MLISKKRYLRPAALPLSTYLPNGAAPAAWFPRSSMNLPLNMSEVNVDENPDVTARFKVRNIPTVLFFKNGEVVDKQVGAVPKASYKTIIEKHI